MTAEVDSRRSEYQLHQQVESGEAWLHYAAGGFDALFELLT